MLLVFQVVLVFLAVRMVLLLLIEPCWLWRVSRVVVRGWCCTKRYVLFSHG